MSFIPCLVDMETCSLQLSVSPPLSRVGPGMPGKFFLLLGSWYRAALLTRGSAAGTAE